MILRQTQTDSECCITSCSPIGNYYWLPYNLLKLILLFGIICNTLEQSFLYLQTDILLISGTKVKQLGGKTMGENAYEELITIDELCETLGIGKNTAYRLLNAKEIESFRIGRVWKIPRRSVSKYVERKCTGSIFGNRS